MIIALFVVAGVAVGTGLGYAASALRRRAKLRAGKDPSL